MTANGIIFNQVSFSHTDGGVAEGAHNDWGQGASDKETGAFFMRNGGYLPTDMRESMVPLNAQHTPVDTIALEPLLQRVDQGVANEQERIRQDEAFEQNLLNKSGWEVQSFSSEETAGEPNGNGLAKWVIDGNNDTYWHSRWTSSTAAYPHTFVIDMKQVYDISAFRITMSGGPTVIFRLLMCMAAWTMKTGHWCILPTRHLTRNRSVFH